MLENALVREIKDPFKKEVNMDPIEVKVYLELLNDKKNSDDNKDKIAEDLFKQLMDKKK